VRLPSQIIGKAEWPFQSRGAHLCSLKKKKIGKGHLTREKKKQEEDDFSVKIFHTKIMIYEDLTVQTQIRFQKRDL
jgi:hypothetical protein